jgi:hypothetical protein
MLTEQQIITEVQTEQIFGLVECDIQTPHHLREIYAEFQPVIKHAYISREEIGEHMKEFAEKNNLLKKPQKTLLCSYYAEKILLATPLLKWYLDHGLEVTHIYQVIQYKPKRCFTRFGNEVMEARRAGDQDKTKKILSDTSKLIGNLLMFLLGRQIII